MGLCLSCSNAVLRLEPSGHLVGNWELEVRWMDFNRDLMLTEPGTVGKCCNPCPVDVNTSYKFATKSEPQKGNENIVKLTHPNKETKNRPPPACMPTRWSIKHVKFPPSFAEVT